MSSSVNFATAGVLGRVRDLRGRVGFRSVTGWGLWAPFARGAALFDRGRTRFVLAAFAGLVVPFVWVNSLPGVAVAASGEFGLLALFELFAIYFSFSSA